MPAKFKRNTSFEDHKPSTGRQDNYKITDHVETYEWPSKGKSGQVRWVGPVVGRGLHEVKVKKKDGSFTKITKVCLAYDPVTDERDSTKKCPYCKCTVEDVVTFKKAYFGNVIDRRLQEDKPKKAKSPTKEESKDGFKRIDSDTWTPVRVARVPGGGSNRLKQLGEKNVVKNKDGKKKSFSCTHPKYGFDIEMSFDKSLPAAQMYTFDRNTDSKFTPITEEEEQYLMWNVEEILPAEDLETAKKELEGILKRLGVGEDEDDDDDDAPKSKKSKAKSKSKAKDEDEDDDDEDEDEDDDDLDLGDKKKKKKASKDEDDEDDDSDDDDDDLGFDDDEDDKKSKKSKSKKASKDDDEDDDEDDSDDEDEDDDDSDDDDSDSDEDEDEDDDDSDEDDDDALDDDDEADSKSKKSSKKAPAKSKKKSKSADEDEDDDDDLDDLDDDEDEEEDKSKKEEKPKKKKPAEKSKKKSSKR